MEPLTRDGGEHAPPRYTTCRPMTAAETANAVEALARTLDTVDDVQAHADGAGGFVARLWADDEEAGIVTFAPVTAVVGPEVRT